VLGLDHFGIRPAGCTAVVEIPTADSQTDGSQREQSDLGPLRILI
jgi:hypothetical protein